MPRSPRLAVAGALLFVVTALLAAAGAFTRIDDFALAHLAPWLNPHAHSSITLATLTLPATGGSLGKQLVDLWIYPASVLPSLVIVVACAWREGLRWLALWVAGNAVEVIGKLVVSRPALRAHGLHATGFDHSLPSGHTIRAFLVAAALTAAWRHGRWAWLWAITVPAALVALGHHVPSDTVAGVFVVLALAGWFDSRRPVTGAAARNC